MAENCEGKVARLKTLFVEVVPTRAAQRVERYRTTVRELGAGSRVETLMKSAMEDVISLLTVDKDLKLAAEPHLEKLAEAKKKVSEIPPSLPDESSAQGIHNYGPGPQNVHTGVGPQNNNNGDGFQITGGTWDGTTFPQKS